MSPSTTVAVTTTTTPTRSDDGELKLGIFLPTTGPGAQLGGPMIDAVNDAIDLINEAGGVLGRPIEVATADEADDTGLEGLLAEDVDAVIGPASSLVALSQLGLTTQTGTGVVTCSPSATALALDDYPDQGYFFRTAPSDSLQMVAIERRAERTGVTTMAIGYLDDEYGRSLSETLQSELDDRARLEMVAEVPFSGDEDDLSGAADELLASDPGVIVVLGDADDGSRLLAALDEATTDSDVPQIIVNDAIRNARQTIQSLSDDFRDQITGVAPLALSSGARSDGFFTANAVDCVNLIALAVVETGTDAPSEFRRNITAVSSGGRVCSTFAACAELLADGLVIDYNGLSGSVELSSSSGDLAQGWFEAFVFDSEGEDSPAAASPFAVETEP